MVRARRWLHAATAVVLQLLGGPPESAVAAGLGRLDSTRNPRYVLCQRPSLPVVKFLGSELRVFAASVAGNEGPDRLRLGRPRNALALRAALVLDDPQAWAAELPQFEHHRPDAGHSGAVSYAKCLGATLPEDVEVGCRLGPSGGRERASAENASDWGQFGHGRVVSFSNKELRHDFAHCVLGAQTVRWRRAPGPPSRLHIRLALRPPGATVATVLPLELCRVEQPLKLASFCSQPLYGLVQMQQEVPWAVDDWLEYHLEHLGFELGEVYDVDGSLAQALGAQRIRELERRGKLVYHARWGANLSRSFASISQRHPYCAETWAYAHCLTTHRALSRWVLLLHAPDEYLVAHRRSEERGVLKVISEYERGMPIDEPMSLMRVRASSFARGGAGDAEQLRGRGGVVAASQLRGELRYWHTPMLDPALCMCAGPHTCYAEAGSEFPGLVQEFEPEDLVVHHYVEMLSGNVGRCAQQHKSCRVPDSSAAHLIPLLRARAP